MNHHYLFLKNLYCLLFSAMLSAWGLGLQAQTTYFSNNNGFSYHNLLNWTDGLPGPGKEGIIQPGATVHVLSPLTIDFVLTNRGNLHAKADVTIASNGTFNNNETNAYIVVEAGKNFINNGTLVQKGIVQIQAGVLANNPGGTYSGQPTGQIFNEGQLTINGSFDNQGTIFNYSVATVAGGNFSTKIIKNHGTINLNGGTTTNISGSDFTIQLTGTVNHANGATFNNFGTATNYNTYVNNGELNNQGYFYSNGLFNNNLNGKIVNLFEFYNNGTFNNNNQGSIINSHLFGNYGTLTNNFSIANGGQLSNYTGGQFINKANATISNNTGGLINSSGTFTNTGQITNVGEIKSFGVFNNDGTIQTDTGGSLTSSGTFTNNNVIGNLEIITNLSGGNFFNNGQLHNRSGGNFQNHGNFYNNQEARISNDFNFTNFDEIFNYGTIENGVRIFNNAFFENSGYLHNIGDFQNNALGIIENKSTGLVENNTGVFANIGTINNNNEIHNLGCSSFINTGILNNYDAFINKGLFFSFGTFNALPNAPSHTDGGVQVTSTLNSSQVCESLTVNLNEQGQITVTGSAIATEAFNDCTVFTLKIDNQASRTFTCANLGTFDAKLTISDRQGTSVNCQTTITVVDDLAPTFQNCPADIVQTATTVNWTPPTFTDNCGQITVSASHNPGATFPVGITTVTYTATDASENQSAPCTFKVTISPQGDCGEVLSVRQVLDVNNNCNSGCNGAYVLNVQGYCLKAGSDLIFIEYSNGTALLTGSIFKGTERAYIEVNFSGRTSTAPSGSPYYALCVNSGASGWKYYTTFSGNIKSDDAIYTISRYGAAFQVGNGASLQQSSTLGASGKFSINGSSYYTGSFNFILSEPKACQSSIYVEAECADAVGGNWTVVNDPNASNGKYLLPPNNNAFDYPPLNTNDLITFNVNVTVPGNYRIFTRSLAPNGASDSYWVRVNNGNWVKWNQVNNPGQNSSYKWNQVGDWKGADYAIPLTFQLNAGANIIQFSWREYGIRFDKLYVTYTGKVPTGAGGTAPSCTNGGGTTPQPCNKTVLFIVGNSTNLWDSDKAVKSRLESRGFTVVTKSATAAKTPDASGKGLVLISSTINSGDVNSKFRDVAVPVMTCEGWLYDDMKMTGTTEGVNYGSLYEARVLIGNASHPLAAGLSGVVWVNYWFKEMNFGKPGTGAINIAHVPNDSGKKLIFAYETGATMVGMTAPARRVGFFGRDESGTWFTQDGWKLFDASVDWLLNCAAAQQEQPCNKKALLITGSSSLNSSDAAIKNRLESLGYAVTAKNDDYVSTSDAGGKGIIVISSTINSGTLGTKFKDVQVPVIVWEAWLFDNMKMTGGTEGYHYGNSEYVRKMTIQDGAHPIAQGMSGDLTIFSSGTLVTWGQPGSGATRIGSVPGSPDKLMLFTYDTGAQMVGMNAPARRVGFYLHNNNAKTMTNDGWRLFDRSVQWASGCNLGVNLEAQDEVLALSAVKNERQVNLYWTNNTGYKNRKFILEKSVDGENFEALTELDAFQEEDISTNLFKEIDLSPATGMNYYRVIVVHLDGTMVSSEVKTVELNEILDFSLYPNPAGSYTDIYLEKMVGQRNVAIKVHDFLGRPVEDIWVEEVTEPFYRLDLNDYEKGRYTVSVIPEGMRPVTQKLIVSK